MRRPLPELVGLELRGVFRRDAAATADPTLPDELFPAGTPVRALATAARRASNTLRGIGPNPALPATALSTVLPRGKEPASRSRADRASRREEMLPRGAIIDKYRIDRLLGRGGFAAVYRATHLLLDSRVAIKLLRPQVVARHPYLAKLLHEEARFAARIDHPNVVKVFDVTHTPRITYVVMEYIDGRSLAETISRSGALPPARVVEIGAAVVAGLKVALAAGLIHRDVKPANILLGRRGETKIVDLGLVLRTNRERSEDEEAAGRRASTVGTYGYMAPEQAVDPDGVDFRADIYSLGATLYEAAVGAPPFPLGDPPRCMELHARAPVPPPEERAPGLPPGLSQLLLRMLAKNPDDRFASYDALAEALARLAAG